MAKQLIFPMAAYVFYIWGLALISFMTRYQAVKTKKVRLSYFKIFEGEIPEKMTAMGRHYDNQFQLPILFFVTCLTHMVWGQVNPWTIVLAWLFIATRLGHSVIHLGKNDITKRMIWFTAGWVVILLMWIQLIYSVCT